MTKEQDERADNIQSFIDEAYIAGKKRGQEEGSQSTELNLLRRMQRTGGSFEIQRGKLNPVLWVLALMLLIFGISVFVGLFKILTHPVTTANVPVWAILGVLFGIFIMRRRGWF